MYRQWYGKRVILTTNTGARYLGLLHPYAENKIALTELCILTKEGNSITSGNKETRIFPITKIKHITAG